MKQVQPLDETTYLAVQAKLSAAVRAGRDQAEALHEAGLLLAPATRRDVEVEALERFERDLARWRPHEFLRRIHKNKASTPADMHEAILGYLADYIKVRRRS